MHLGHQVVEFQGDVPESPSGRILGRNNELHCRLPAGAFRFKMAVGAGHQVVVASGAGLGLP